jgi:hypothetical protein
MAMINERYAAMSGGRWDNCFLVEDSRPRNPY